MKQAFTLLFSLSLLAFTATASAESNKGGWDDNYAQALTEAKQQNKEVLLNFTGSDWCIFCMKLDKEVFSKAGFQRLAQDKLKLVEIDFPEGKSLPGNVAQQNARLKSQFNINGFPTIVLLDAEGHEQARWEGYNPDLLNDLKTKLGNR